MYGITWDASSGIQSTFKKIATQILSNGLTSMPRQYQTKQCIGATIIMDPNDTMIRNKQRKMNYVFSMIQKIIYTSGNGFYTGILEWYNSNYTYYEDGIDIGNYGWRIAPQLRQIVDILTDDPDSRQAIISVYNPMLDQKRQTVDVPCTLTLHFMIRQGKLDMIVSMRSNDLLWGFSYDINQFAYIQKLLAGILGFKTGKYIHHSNSLHIYDYSYQSFQKIIQCDEYFTKQQQPDFAPSYYKGRGSQQRLTRYFNDCQVFWKAQGLTRCGKLDLLNRLNFQDKKGFFKWRTDKVCNYNAKKITQKDFLKKYFERDSFKPPKNYY